MDPKKGEVQQGNLMESIQRMDQRLAQNFDRMDRRFDQLLAAIERNTNPQPKTVHQSILELQNSFQHYMDEKRISREKEKEAKEKAEKERENKERELREKEKREEEEKKEQERKENFEKEIKEREENQKEKERKEKSEQENREKVRGDVKGVFVDNNFKDIIPSTLEENTTPVVKDLNFVDPFWCNIFDKVQVIHVELLNVVNACHHSPYTKVHDSRSNRFEERGNDADPRSNGFTYSTSTRHILDSMRKHVQWRALKCLKTCLCMQGLVGSKFGACPGQSTDETGRERAETSLTATNRRTNRPWGQITGAGLSSKLKKICFCKQPVL